MMRNLSPPYPPKSAFFDNIRHGPNNKNLVIPNEAESRDDENVIKNNGEIDENKPLPPATNEGL